jgi:hypothetical protein
MEYPSSHSTTTFTALQQRRPDGRGGGLGNRSLSTCFDGEAGRAMTASLPALFSSNQGARSARRFPVHSLAGGCAAGGLLVQRSDRPAPDAMRANTFVPSFVLSPKLHEQSAVSRGIRDARGPKQDD